MWLTILIGLLVLLIYFKIIRPLNYWQERGVPSLKPWPIVGNLGSYVLRQTSFADYLLDLYNKFPEQRYVGLLQFLQPTLMLRDPALIRQLMVKNFDNFPQHQTYVPEGIDSLWDKNLLAMKGGSKWQDLRSTLSPSFTNNKMKIMFGLIKDCAKQFTGHFQKHGTGSPVEMKDACSRYSNDVISTTALGVSCNSLKNQDNEVFTNARDLTDVSGIRGLLFLASTICSYALILLRIKIIPRKVSTFFTQMISETIKVREEKGIVRPDMIHLLLEARKGRGKQEEETNVDAGFAAVQDAESEKAPKKQKAEISDEDIVAQAVVFFIAGFDTVSTLMSFLCYELAVNPEVQRKLADEIDAASKKCNGDISYEALLELKYLDMVISECLRKWPPAEVTDRQCVKEFTIEPELPGEKPLRIEVGVGVWIPIFAIHRDPQYYPDPDKFDPERFSDENKKNINPFNYLPFGVGQRICIGLRFGLLETKLVMFEFLSKFELVPVEQTQIPLALSKGNWSMITDKGIWLGVKPRKASH